MLQFTVKILVLGLICVSSSIAHAGGGMRLAVDGGANVNLDGSSTDLGIRLGRHMQFAVVHLTPEVGGRMLGGAISPHAGLRVGLGKGVVPTLYAHYGYVMQSDVSWFEAGAALDLTFVPKINFGPHFSYTALGESGFSTVGGHLGVTF